MSVRVFAFSISTRGVDPQPLPQAATLEISQNRPDGIVVIAIDANQRLQILPRHAVPLDQITVVDMRRPGGGVKHERVNTLPLQHNCLGGG